MLKWYTEQSQKLLERKLRGGPTPLPGTMTIKGFIRRHDLSGGEALIAKQMLNAGKSEIEVEFYLTSIGSDEMAASLTNNVLIEAAQADILASALKEIG